MWTGCGDVVVVKKGVVACDDGDSLTREYVVKAMVDFFNCPPVWEFWQLAGREKCAMENGVILN